MRRCTQLYYIMKVTFNALVSLQYLNKEFNPSPSTSPNTNKELDSIKDQ